jgi:hypothetical protein
MSCGEPDGALHRHLISAFGESSASNSITFSYSLDLIGTVAMEQYMRLGPLTKTEAESRYGRSCASIHEPIL